MAPLRAALTAGDIAAASFDELSGRFSPDPVLCRLFGLAAGEALSAQAVRQAVSSLDLLRFDALLAALPRRLGSDEIRVTWPDRSVHRVRLAGAPTAGSEDRSIACEFVAYETFDAASIAVVVHDLNNLLLSIHLALLTLAELRHGDAEIDPVLATAESALSEATDLVRTLGTAGRRPR